MPFAGAPELKDDRLEKTDPPVSRSRIKEVLDEPFESAPDTRPSPGEEESFDHMLLAGRTAVYQGEMIPSSSGVISVHALNGGLSINLDFEAKDGTRMKGYLRTDENGQNAVITDSEAGLNNYFRYRYPNQVQELVNELLGPLKQQDR